jgi:hypothetical protein
MLFTMNRDRIVVSTSGHAIEFKKGEPTHVPPEMYDLVQEQGAVTEEDIVSSAPPAGTAPTSESDRQEMLLMAIETIVTRNRREDFTASGAPHGKALFAELGWKIDNRERDAAWAKFQTGKD